MAKFYDQAIKNAAQDLGLDPLLIEAVIQQESAGKADAFRHEPGFWLRYLAKDKAFKNADPRRVASSYGLMQIMYTTALELGFVGEPEELFQVDLNISLGSRLLKKLLDRFKNDTEKALAAYNGGPGGVSRPQPLAYAKTVLMRYDFLKSTSLTSRDRPGNG